MLEQIEERVKELEKAVEQSMANHNVLFGQLGEARYLLELLKKSATTTVETVVEISNQSQVEQVENGA